MLCGDAAGQHGCLLRAELICPLLFRAGVGYTDGPPSEFGENGSLPVRLVAWTNESEHPEGGWPICLLVPAAWSRCPRGLPFARSAAPPSGWPLSLDRRQSASRSHDNG